MLLSLQSTNEDYSTIRTNIDIPWECKYVKYWISCVNFNAHIYRLTEDDYIKYHVITPSDDPIHPTDVEIRFNDINPHTRHELVALMNIVDTEEYVEFVMDVDTGWLMTMNVKQGYSIIFDDITPRARMVCGLMNVEIGKEYPHREDDDGNDIPYVFDIPIFDFANKLYIISKQGNAVHANVGKQDMMPSILASIDTVIRDGAPVIVNFETYGKPIKNKVNIDSFKYLELQLVDMMFQPVKLLNPMFITMKVKPCKTPQMRLSE